MAKVRTRPQESGRDRTLQVFEIAVVSTGTRFTKPSGPRYCRVKRVHDGALGQIVVGEAHRFGTAQDWFRNLNLRIVKDQLKDVSATRRLRMGQSRRRRRGLECRT
jgi:hypothetical protein